MEIDRLLPSFFLMKKIRSFYIKDYVRVKSNVENITDYKRNVDSRLDLSVCKFNKMTVLAENSCSGGGHDGVVARRLSHDLPTDLPVIAQIARPRRLR